MARRSIISQLFRQSAGYVSVSSIIGLNGSFQACILILSKINGFDDIDNNRFQKKKLVFSRSFAPSVFLSFSILIDNSETSHRLF